MKGKIVSVAAIVALVLGAVAVQSVLAEEPQSLGAVGVADDAGIRIVQIISGGPAETAGLTVGDVLTTMDGKAVKKIAEKSALMTSKQAGSKLVVTYLRKGQRTTATLIVGMPVQTTAPTPAGAQGSDSSKKVSIEFAKAANLALVAVKNRSAWNLQEEAINNAEAEAVSPEEIAAVASIKSLAGRRAILQQIWENYSSVAFDRFVSRNPGAKGEEINAAINADPKVSAAQKNLDKNDACNVAWRLALRDRDGTEPVACKP